MSTVEWTVVLCAGVAAGCWLLSVITHEYSWVDRLWSVLPPIYVGIYAHATDFSDARLLLMTALSALWGARLTFNFARKGGYARGGEDYRWAVLRQRLSPWQYQLLNFFFIAGIQNALLWALALPAWVAWQHRGTPLGVGDGVAAALFLLLLLGETIADQQQWQFQQQKKARQARGETVDPPFLTTGLFRFSRHPNFFCEVSQWWVFYAFSVLSGGAPLNESIVGALVLTALFHGSTNFTEALSLAKYPTYAAYQKTVSRLIPWL